MRGIRTGKNNQTLNIRRGSQESYSDGEKLFIHVVERDENGKETIIKKTFITAEVLRELVMNDMGR